MLVMRLREAHHAAAKYFARDLPLAEVSVLTGHPVERLATLKRDPSFNELVSFYRGRTKSAHSDSGSGESVMQALRDVVRAAA